MVNAWVIRAGSVGEQEQANLESGTAAIGWEVGDLSACTSREDVRALIDAAYPSDTLGRRANATGQVWAFSHTIALGDIIVMPSKHRPGYMYLGRCLGNYRYVADEADRGRRHQLPVKWLPEPVSKSVIKDDLLYSLNGIMTVFNPSRNNAAERILALYERGADPGNNVSVASLSNTPLNSVGMEMAEVTDPDPVPTLEAIRDRIRTHLVENFAGHKLTYLVADILEALGFRCEVSPPGGRRRCGHPRGTQHRADQGLLVAWGGVTGPAAREFLRDRTSFRIWDSEELLSRLFETYDQLPASTRARIPLKQAWVLDENA